MTVLIAFLVGLIAGGTLTAWILLIAAILQLPKPQQPAWIREADKS